jgi:hypothetical protein
LKDFDRSLTRVKKVLFARYGEDEATTLMGESRHQYEDLIPQIPYIGDRNPFLIFLLPATRYLAVYRAFKKHGRTVEEVGHLVYEMGEAEFKNREYSGDYVLNYVAGEQDFDWGVDYIECASCKFLDKQDAAELKPYVCAVDKVASEMLGWGLRRTMTLAEGDERCDFRFKKGGETSVSIPQSLM